ncbi:hypothetical protein NH340_JMT05238 [Sarcoptes scabiei]|nr:hypothetical protein NH340_JMT05238 [Sarcoptes scabiei]
MLVRSNKVSTFLVYRIINNFPSDRFDLKLTESIDNDRRSDCWHSNRSFRSGITFHSGPNHFGLMLPTAIFYVKNFSHPKRFALNWSFVSISVNVAGIINPLLTTWLNAKFGWRFAVNFSGTITLATGISIWLLCGNKNRQIESKKCDDTKSSEPQKPQRLNFSIFQNMIFIIISLIAINRFVVILIRSSIHDWTQLIFVNDLNLTLNQSSLFVSTMETSSIIGKLISGYLNDLVGSNSRSKISNRASLSIVWHLLSSLSLLFYFQLNASSSLISLLLIASMIGCSTSANVITLNIFSTEISSVTETNTKRSVGHKGLFMSITNMASQFGAFLSGYPITIMSSTLGWSQTFFSIQIIISMIIIFDLIFIWKQRYDAIKNKCNNVLVETF